MKPAGNWNIRDSAGQALMWHLANSDSWHHRKIESYRLLDGPRSRRHVSIDLVVPNDERLLVQSRLNEVASELLVPLALVRKAALQDFDATVGTTPMLVADTSLNGTATVELIRSSWQFDLGRAPSEAEDEFFNTVVFGLPAEQSLVGQFFDEQFERDPSAFASLSDFTRGLLASVEECFLLIGLLPKDLAGSHVVVKYSEHWELVSADRSAALSRWAWLLAATGWQTVPLAIDMNDAGLRPSSYHVEVHAPTGLINEGLSVESESDDVPMGSDRRHTSVSHVAVRGEDLPRQAYVEMGVVTHGLLARAAFAYAASFVLFAAASFTTVAGAVFQPTSRSATSLFLAVIAVLLGSLTRETENPVSSRLLLPLRFLMIGLAGMYFVAAATIAVGASFDFGVAMTRVELAMLVVGAAIVVGGYLSCQRRQVGLGSQPEADPRRGR